MIIKPQHDLCIVDPSHPLARGLICGFEFTEMAGKLVVDIRREHFGVHQGTLTDLWGADKHGPHFKANGTNNYLSVPDAPEMNIGSGDMTLLLHGYRGGAVTYSGLAGKANLSNASQGWWLTCNTPGTGNDFWFTMGDTDHFATASTIPINTEFWLVVVKRGQNIDYYRDGLYSETVNEGVNLTNHANPLRLMADGTAYGTNYSPGKMYRFRWWDRALAADEIYESFKNPLGILYRPRRVMSKVPAVGGGSALLSILQQHGAYL